MQKKLLLLVAMTLMVSSATIFTSCSSEADYLLEDMQCTSMGTRSGVSRSLNTGSDYTINFDNTGLTLAGPTSYGENLYSSYNVPFVSSSIAFASDNAIYFGINNMYGSYDFWNGGVAVSNWAIRTNDSSHSGDWWYSYNNQCSVYNISTTMPQSGAGHSGNNFAIVYGYEDAYNTSWMKKPELTFEKPVNLKSLYYCNSSYVYGVLESGNQFGDSLTTIVPAIKTAKGYFEVVMELYDENDSLITTQIMLLADYRVGHARVVPIATWTLWEMKDANNVPSPVVGVKRIKFNFDGSDKGDYGLNTPAYICIDDITVEY